MITPPFTVEPDAPRASRPPDTYDVVNGNGIVLVGSVTFDEATWIADTLNKAVGYA